MLICYLPARRSVSERRRGDADRSQSAPRPPSSTPPTQLQPVPHAPLNPVGLALTDRRVFDLANCFIYHRLD